MRKGVYIFFLLIAFAAIVGLALVKEHPSAGFTPEQMRFLEGEMPRGHFFGPSSYRNCESGNWVVYEANGDWYPLIGQCWLDRMPLYPEWMEPK